MRTPLPSFKTNACPFAHTHAVKKVALPAESAVLLTTGSGTVCSSTSCGQQGDRGGRVRVVAVGRCGRGCYVVACIQARQRRRVQQQGQALMGAVCSNPVGLPPCTSPADTRALRGRSKGRGSQALLPTPPLSSSPAPGPPGPRCSRSSAHPAHQCQTRPGRWRWRRHLGQIPPPAWCGGGCV